MLGRRSMQINAGYLSSFRLGSTFNFTLSPRRAPLGLDHVPSCDLGIVGLSISLRGLDQWPI